MCWWQCANRPQLYVVDCARRFCLHQQSTQLDRSLSAAVSDISYFIHLLCSWRYNSTPLPCNNSRLDVHTMCDSITKQYNLVQIYDQVWVNCLRSVPAPSATRLPSPFLTASLKMSYIYQCSLKMIIISVWKPMGVQIYATKQTIWHTENMNLELFHDNYNLYVMANHGTLFTGLCRLLTHCRVK